jgi:hypothetical protein
MLISEEENGGACQLYEECSNAFGQDRLFHRFAHQEIANPGLLKSLLAQGGRDLRPMTHAMGQGLCDRFTLAGSEIETWTDFNHRREVPAGALAK